MDFGLPLFLMGETASLLDIARLGFPWRWPLSERDLQKRLPGGCERASRAGKGEWGAATGFSWPLPIYIRTRQLMLWITPEEKAAIRAERRTTIY
jgi:hypothetical protein